MKDTVVLKVNLDQRQYDKLADWSTARGMSLGATVRILINQLSPSTDGLETTKCQPQLQ